MNNGRQMTNKSPRTQWRQEYLARKAGLSKFQTRLLEEGPKSLSQAWYLGAMHQDYEKMMGIKKPPTRESGHQTTLKEFFARWK